MSNKNSLKKEDSSDLANKNIILSQNIPRESLSRLKYKQISEEFINKCISNKKITHEEIQKHKEKFAEFYEKIYLGNQEWAKKKKDIDEKYFEKLANPQTPKYLVIACSDSRLVVNEFTATEPGDVFTHRNIGNLVISTDFNVESVIQYAVEYLKVEHILVIGHTDCGAIKAALSNNYHGLIDHWLKHIREVAEKYVHELDVLNSPPENVVRKLIELNIREQCLNICKNPIIQKAWDKGHDIYIHGFVFEIETGLLKELEYLQTDWLGIQDIYKFNFTKQDYHGHRDTRHDFTPQK
jgi:carbonic anhydrase